MYVKDLELFVTVQLPDDTPPVLLLGKLCEDHGNSYGWTISELPHLMKNGRKIPCNMHNYVPTVVPGLSSGISSSSLAVPPSASSSQNSSPENCTQRSVKKKD